MNKATIIKQSDGFAVMCEGYVQGVFVDESLAQAWAASINDAAIVAFFREVTA
jgi:hypothetical protein